MNTGQMMGQVNLWSSASLGCSANLGQYIFKSIDPI